MSLPRRRCAPSPRRGEGSGEGVETYREPVTPHPNPLPMGEGDRRARGARGGHNTIVESAHESAGGLRDCGRRYAARAGERVAGVRWRQSGDRRFLRHPQRRDPRHHRPKWRRQDIDAQRHQRLLPPAARPHHLQGPNAYKNAPVRCRARRHRAHVSERRAVQGYDGARQHHGGSHAQDAPWLLLAGHKDRARPCRRGGAPPPRRGNHRFSEDPAHPPCPGRPVAVWTCRSASNSGGRWLWSRTCCCSTSQWPE